MFGSSEMVIVLVIVLVLFGGSQLPKLARNLGKAQKEFKDGVGEAESKTQTDAAATQAVATPPATPSAAPVAAPPADPPVPPIA
jgi:sec-independent protein translocase protein TatA